MVAFCNAINHFIERIKVGKRRSQAETPNTTGIFSGFAGFKPNGASEKAENPSVESVTPVNAFHLTPTTDVTKSNVAFPIFKNLTDNKQSIETKETNNNVTAEPFKLFGTKPSETSIKEPFKKSSAEGESKIEELSEDSKKFEMERHSKTFQHKLGSLNRSVVKWIVSHVEDNDCVDLTPVFADYRKHLKKIDDEYQRALKDLSSKDKSSTENQSLESTSVPGKSVFAFLNKANAEENASDKPFVFGANNTTGTGVSINTSGTNPFSSSSKPPASGNISLSNTSATVPSSSSTNNSVSPLASTFNSPKKETAPKFGSSDSVKLGLFAGLVNPAASFTTNSDNPSKPLFPSTISTENAGDETKPAPIFPAGFNFKPADNSVPQIFGANLFKSSTAATNGGDAQPVLVAPSIFGSFAQKTTASFTDTTKTEISNTVANAGDQEAGESEEPPKNEFKEVEEPGAYYSVRCKMFFKKGSEWKSKAVGMLHFKKFNDKTQLVLRADTNLGNIFLNIILDPNTPIKQAGKTNISMVTVANPPVEDKCPQCEKKYTDAQTSNECESKCTPKPSTLMFKVKTEDECNKFFEHLQKAKES